MLVLANAVTLVVALALRWPVATLLWPFWVQSVIIGYFSRERMLALGRFSTEGFLVNDRPVDPTPKTKHETANFFALHYGLFHFVYLLVLATEYGDLDGWDWLGLGVAGVSFAWNHYFSFQRNIAADRRGTPNIGTLMFLPYCRIVPMHCVIGVGAGQAGRGVAMILTFTALKTAADLLMHYVEHRVLRRRPAPTTPARPPLS